jgi:hypothetical protein
MLSVFFSTKQTSTLICRYLPLTAFYGYDDVLKVGQRFCILPVAFLFTQRCIAISIHEVEGQRDFSDVTRATIPPVNCNSLPLFACIFAKK